MAKKKRTSRVVWLRRGVQSFFLLLFLYLFLQTTFHPDNRVGRGVTIFFELDPLVLLVTWIGSSPVPPILLISLITAGVTLLFGRWFCGWVCPFGVLHNLFTSRRVQPVKTKLDRGGYSRFQKSKYYILIGSLGAAVAGANLVGWLDPFSFFFRALAVSIYPALNRGAEALFTWVYQADPGVGPARVAVVSEPAYQFLRDHFLSIDLQPQYQWGLLIGSLFVLAVGLNFHRPRFWCRYVCPLGALLGLIGKNPVLRLKKNAELCNNCRLCVEDCAGGANPHATNGWKPAECFYCWNCESACPHAAISFGFRAQEEHHDKTPA